jgi:hypothetical protein
MIQGKYRISSQCIGTRPNALMLKEVSFDTFNHLDLI